MMNRRNLLIALTGTPVALAGLNGCAETQKIVSDIDTLATGVASVLPIIQGIQGVSADVVAKVQSAVAAVQAGASDLDEKIASGLSTVGSKVSAGLSTIQTVLSALPPSLHIPQWASIIVTAAQTALPFILHAAGLTARMAATAPGQMSFAQSMTILRAAAAH